ncbi:ABC transporter permease [Stella sp.]|uniref:ABC transporter permease n=1 Tax=Stella sp. TaxID=2912054 RepID=UPI0035B016AC
MSVVTEDAAGGRRRSVAPALVGPATILVAFVLVVPMAILFRYSLNQFVPGQFMVEAVTGANYVKFFTDSYYLNVLWTTVQVAVACTVISLTLAFPVAYFLARTTSRFKSMLVILAVFPLMVGNVVRAAGWMVVLGNEGVVNAVLRWVGLTAEPIKLLYTPTAVVIGIIAVVLPYMILTLQSVLEGIDYSVEEAALNLGAGPSTTFFRIVLPLAMPGVVAGTVLVFILCMNAYATPVLLGGPQFKMMAPALYDQIARSTNWPFGAALAFVLMATTLTLTIVSTTVMQRRMRR